MEPVTMPRAAVSTIGANATIGATAQSAQIRCQSAATLLEQATAGLAEAGRSSTPGGRFAPARLAALRAAAAVVATRAEPSRISSRARARPRSVWVLLASVAPELGEWSLFFAACAGNRTVTTRDADDMLRQAEQFLALARAAAVAGPRWP